MFIFITIYSYRRINVINIIMIIIIFYEEIYKKEFSNTNHFFKLGIAIVIKH
jgi:hypothetical protein